MSIIVIIQYIGEDIIVPAFFIAIKYPGISNIQCVIVNARNIVYDCERKKYRKNDHPLSLSKANTPVNFVQENTK